ncbi:Gypsy retrotransposon integrase-like protein 1 [Savitreella phatthalungensis]
MQIQQSKSPAAADKTSSPGPDPAVHDKRSANATPDSASDKRRRVARACDSCRRQKIRCNGENPCKHCSGYGYECTWDKPSYRNANLSVAYVRTLEARLKQLEESATSTAPPSRPTTTGPSSELRSSVERYQAPQLNRPVSSSSAGERQSPPPGIDLRSVDADERERNELAKHELPPYHVALRLTGLFFDYVCTLVDCIHRSYFYANMAGHYGDMPDNAHSAFLPLLFSVLAVGTLFAQEYAEQFGIVDINERARLFYTLSERFTSPLERTGMHDVQAMAVRTLYLRCTGATRSAWALIGAACRHGLNLGLDADLPEEMDLLDQQRCRKTYYTLYNLNAILSIAMGRYETLVTLLPRQQLPFELDDAFVTQTGLVAPPPGSPPASVLALNALTRLLGVATRIAQTSHGHETQQERPAYPNPAIEHLQAELDAWWRALPAHLQHNESSSEAQRQGIRHDNDQQRRHHLMNPLDVHDIQVDYALQALSLAYMHAQCLDLLYANYNPDAHGELPAFDVYAARSVAARKAVVTFGEAVTSERPPCALIVSFQPARHTDKRRRDQMYRWRQSPPVQDRRGERFVPLSADAAIDKLRRGEDTTSKRPVHPAVGALSRWPANDSRTANAVDNNITVPHQLDRFPRSSMLPLPQMMLSTTATVGSPTSGSIQAGKSSPDEHHRLLPLPMSAGFARLQAGNTPHHATGSQSPADQRTAADSHDYSQNSVPGRVLDSRGFFDPRATGFSTAHPKSPPDVQNGLHWRTQ